MNYNEISSGVKIGPVVKKDVMRASTMLEHEEKFAVILAFDVKVEREAQEMADREGVKIFQADIIYHLFDRSVQPISGVFLYCLLVQVHRVPGRAGQTEEGAVQVDSSVPL